MNRKQFDEMAEEVRVTAIHAYPTQVGDCLGTSYVAPHSNAIGAVVGATYVGSTPIDVIIQVEGGTKVIRPD